MIRQINTILVSVVQQYRCHTGPCGTRRRWQIEVESRPWCWVKENVCPKGLHYYDDSTYFLIGWDRVLESNSTFIHSQVVVLAPLWTFLPENSIGMNLARTPKSSLIDY